LLFGLVLNGTVKRAQELETRMGLPLSLTIPYFTRIGASRLPLTSGKMKLPAGVKKAGLAPWEKGHAMLPYAEAVRDRLYTFFDANGIPDKPKLIGVTGFSEGAGVSTLAAGLAGALSATDGNKVLLVDMKEAGHATRAFSGGKPIDFQVPQDATKSTDVETVASDDLKLATKEHGPNGNSALGFSEFRRVMGELKTQGSDYLVFDMPPISEISPSAAIGGLMDHVLAVVESEGTQADAIKRGYRDLMGAHASVSFIFNKARAYGPKALVGT
jgi:Mrp family chromosome partitioning ATPase